jgi:quinol monooxygenase YgiN
VKGENRAGTIYVLTHVDVFAQYEKDCLAFLKAMSVDSSQDDGNLGYELLQQANHPNHFTVVEEWTTRKALYAHLIAAHTRAFREKLSSMEGSPYDARFYDELD